MPAAKKAAIQWLFREVLLGKRNLLWMQAYLLKELIDVVNVERILSQNLETLLNDGAAQVTTQPQSPLPSPITTQQVE